MPKYDTYQNATKYFKFLSEAEKHIITLRCNILVTIGYLGSLHWRSGEHWSEDKELDS